MAKHGPDDFEHGDFWRKARRFAGKFPFVRDLVAMYYAMMDSETPVWVKTAIAGAIVYFILPFDAVPDVLLPGGFLDDAGVVASTLALVDAHVMPKHYRKADQALG